MTGISIPINEISMADCCELVLLEINNPKERAVRINKLLMANNNNTLPFNGIPNKKTLSTKMRVRFTNERKK